MMGSFFHGWRRKIGMATLVAALVFMGGWVRSNAVDELATFTAMNSLHWLSSDHFGLKWRIVRPCSVNFGSHWYSSPLNRDAEATRLYNLKKLSRLNGELEYLDRFDSKRRWQWCGFCFGEGHDNRPSKDQIVIIVVPHWSPILLLTLISAYLLLIKPRPTTQNKITEPIPETVA